MKVAIIMGSSSDMPKMKKACEVLNEYKVDFITKVVSAHRTPDYMAQFAAEAKNDGIHVIIAGAGGAAHLPGMVAAHTVLPVIGVPLNRTALNGTDALHSVVQMPAGVPVATVGIDNSHNAALLAIQILALQDDQLWSKLLDARTNKHRDILNTTLDWNDNG